MPEENNRTRFRRFQTFFHAFHVVLALAALIFCLFGGARDNYPLLIPLLSGMLIGVATHHGSLVIFTITSLFIPTFETAREILSRYIAVLGLILWLFLYVLDTEGRLLIHGYGIYIFMNIFNAAVRMMWDLCLAHCGLDRRTNHP